MSFGIGIDLGTTNSAASTAILQNGKLTTPILNIDRYTSLGPRGKYKSERGKLLPSFVAYIEQKSGEYEPIVGDFAKELACTQPYAVACSIKSQMGQPTVNIPGWKREYPDQKPEEISAQILRKIHSALKNQIDPYVNDAVITIPASFNIAQCEATLRAAELAGFKVRQADGTFRDDVLLSEPEAVIYDVLNQLQNGDIHITMDFTEPRHVMVFDIGGGTLDITLHSICRNEEHTEVFDIRPLATNRYSVVAGDTFDQALAERMFEKYLHAYEAEDAEAARRIQNTRPAIMTYLRRYAEELKLDISERYQQQKAMGQTLSLSRDFEYGGEMPNGYNCEDYMELAEFEEVLQPLMGEQFSLDDYKHLSGRENSQNIIYPILNVLAKAADKLGTEDVKVDAVILNGGMSRLYLIERRLEQFFGFRMITVNDPDKSVAQGAAVYHYYLRSGQSALYKQHMKFLSEQRTLENASFDFMDITPPESIAALPTDETDSTPMPLIRSLGGVQNETLYIGLKGGVVQELVKSGQDLPYQSPRIEDFCVAPGQDSMTFPIRQEGTQPGQYITIASGSIRFGTKYDEEMPVAIQFLLRRDGILNLEAWIDGEHIGDTTIVFGDSGSSSANKNNVETLADRVGKKKLLPPKGPIMNVSGEISSLKQIVKNLKRAPSNKSFLQQMANKKKQLLLCGNPEDFATPMLELLMSDSSPLMAKNVLPVMRRFCEYWQDSERKILSRRCLGILHSELLNFPAQGVGVNANIEAIQTVGACGIREDCEKLTPLCRQSKYRSALLRAFGMSGIQHEWIHKEFLKQCNTFGSTQDTLQAIGLLMRYGRASIRSDELDQIAADVIDYMNTGDYSRTELNLAVVTVALVCMPDTIRETSAAMRTRATEFLLDMEETLTISNCGKALSVANRLLSGKNLEEEQEQYLLGLLNPDARP